MSRSPRVAVVGHVEWVTHARGRLPGPGEITRLVDPIQEPAGGGGVAASQVAKLGAETLFFTALGDDEAGDLAKERLEAVGVRVLAARRRAPQTRALSVVGDSGDRAIAVVGVATDPVAADDLPWDELAACDAVYFTGRAPEVLRRARAGARLVVTARRRAALDRSGVRPDVVVASASDAGEPVDVFPIEPGAVVVTDGAAGGRYREGTGPWTPYPPARPPAPLVDTYGSGDSFAAGLTTGLGRGLSLRKAIDLGALCGAINVTGRGGLAAQLRGDGL